MKYTINTSSDQNIAELINNISSEIFDEKIWFGEEMWKIAEVTYSYANVDDETKKQLKINGKNIDINTTLFVSLGKLNLELFSISNDDEKVSLLEKASQKIEEKIISKIKQIQKAISKIEKIDTSHIEKSELYKLEILLDSLIEKKNLLNYCLNGLDYEKEKAGIETNLSKKDEIKINKKQKKLDKILFGGEIIENPGEADLCYNHILNIFNKNKSKLTPSETQGFKKYLDKASKYLSKGYECKEEEKLDNELSELSKYMIQQKDYILGFNLFIEAFSEMEFNVEINPFVKSISDGPDGFQIPTSEEFKKFDFSRFLLLNAHENETHNISEHNSQKIIGNIRGKDSITKEEGVAKLMENMLKFGNKIFKVDEKTGKTIFDLEKLEIASNFAKTFFGEILDNDDFLDFLEISYKLDKDIISPKDRFNRLKRSNKKGVQHKDTTYTRGLFQAAKEVNDYILSDGKKGISFFDLFIAKVGFQDINKVAKIKKDKKIKILHPMFLSDIVFFAIKNKLRSIKSLNPIIILEYLQEKYPIIDFTEEMINSISNKTIIIIDGIINLGIKSIFAQETNETIIVTKERVSDIIIKGYIDEAIAQLKPKRKKALI